MIEAIYDRKNLMLSVKGHAHSGEPGHDLVCAAASILTYTLAANVAEMSADKKRVRRPSIKLEEGNAEITCAPVHGMHALTELVFDNICCGFDILQTQYPENISYKVVG